MTAILQNPTSQHITCTSPSLLQLIPENDSFPFPQYTWEHGKVIPHSPFLFHFFVFFTHFSLPFLNPLFHVFYITFSLFVGSYWSRSSSSSYRISSTCAAVFQPWKDKRTRNAPFNHSMKRSAGTCWHYYTNISAFQQNSQLGEQFAWWLFRSGR